MRVRRLWFVLGILLIPSVASADDHRAGLFPGFSYEQGSKLFGFHFATDITLPAPKSRDLSLIGDFSVHGGSRDGVDVTRTVYAVGLRWSFAKDGSIARTAPVPWSTFGVHALVGSVYDTAGSDEGADAIFVVGASYDFIPALAPDGGGWGVRFQADYVIRAGESTDSFPRVSVGVVKRIGK